ncbi:DEAD/DEAH box helicase [Metabacillus sp. GX 13764]|uniref:DEAD/DEAH box helicase n=1 Tax=Metabacillus kandeliae TaxID=2900151 RepID=UPI001E502E6E|nr:DEAD/DEAH box helicase [Metabacillus kandeliae]MCD7036513.1 DEAD/DEAH box helicase [Metabacillus kandeliae]
MTEIKKLSPFLQQAWEKAGFADLTPIQEKAIPLLLEGKDVIGQSPTGTGKTLAYLLPILERLDPSIKQLQAVILASSHELVMQITEEIQKWTAGSEYKGASFIGGANIKRQVEKLKKPPQIAAGTPGRIHELIKMKKMKMHQVKTIIIDEGDQLLVPAHLPTVQQIIKSTLSERQMALFSATLPEATETAAKELMKDPVVVRAEDAPKSQAEHIYFVCEQRDKLSMLERVVRANPVKTLAFMRDIGNLTVASEKLEYDRIPAGVLHSDSGKQDREAALKGFRSGKHSLLLATDVAARGLDIKELQQVIHADFPADMDQYVHRSGRTGRLGSEGTGLVVSLVTEREERELKKYARELGVELQKKLIYHGEIMSEEERANFGKRR